MSDVPKKALEMDSGAAAETSIDNETQGPSNTMDDETAALYPMGIKLAVITISLMLAVLCVALDNTIIAVAIPHITDQFHNLNDVGWYASAYLLTTCALQLLFGKLYALFSVKIVFLSALFVFELGSLICGIAPTSTALIIGRAIAGLGSAGIFTGALVMIAHTVAREKRPMFFGLLGGMYGIASVAGPLMGGAFTDHATWRWCFYINLPLGGVTAVVILLILKLPPKPASKRGSFLQVLKRLDPIGTAVFIPSIICLLLALQWGGVKYQWLNARIIVLFAIFGVLLIGFVTIQLIMKDDATVPPRIAGNRTITSAALFGFCIGGSFFILTYYIPIWFQVIKNTSAVRSGIYSLPMILENVGDEHDLVTLSHTQCWSLIANFEALHMMFTQALTSLCRGIRMAQALGLHQLGEESEGATLASAQERIILEEQRRTWWFLFLSDRLVCGTTGLPLCINQKDVTTLLPTSEKAFADGHSEPASPLKPLHSFTTLGSSILTARVFIANLFHRVLNHTSCISPGIHIKRDQHEFWDRHCRLDNELSLCTIKLPENARIGNPIYNRDAVIVNTELQAAIISLHRGAIWNLSFSEHNSCGEEVKRQQAHHSQERVMNSAQEIAHILRIAGAYSTTFMNPILIFSVYLSAFAFIEDFLDTQKNRVRILL
ncbi:hypothetical protein FOPG_17267 [Fusarium oxysporum f. sp. conglutinans race 2 54008]|uniref:Major facilitator superfamily (MFS) profile domain-containing protein n=1 Tax=Fusarium oxysporum f. sp. conglutinans race 2 54008 TaxID=1089457 RepID=X0H3G4_FUSOX|nr:hypothetical protein FOPG_17267 [Fusarium oxysporum f. sp. conglutinans race 2 54008]